MAHFVCSKVFSSAKICCPEKEFLVTRSDNDYDVGVDDDGDDDDDDGGDDGDDYDVGDGDGDGDGDGEFSPENVGRVCFFFPSLSCKWPAWRSGRIGDIKSEDFENDIFNDD